MTMVSAANSITGMNLIRMETNPSEGGSAGNLSFIQNAKERGWITAGMYYRDLLTKNGYTQCKAFQTANSDGIALTLGRRLY